MSSEEPQESYREYCTRINYKFKKYRETHRLNLLPDIESDWRDYDGIWDIDTVLRPIIEECKILIYENLLENENSLENTCKALERFTCHLKNIQEKENIDLSFALNWMEFHSARFRKLTFNDEGIDILNNWLLICYDLENRGTEYYFTFYQLNRGQEMRHLVFDEKGEVRKFFCSDITPGRLYVSKLVTWFLCRYNLVAASALLNFQSSDQPKPNNIIKHGFGFSLPCRFWVISGLTLLILLSFLFFAGGILFTYQPDWTWIKHLWKYFQYPPFGSSIPPHDPSVDLKLYTQFSTWLVLPYQLGSLMFLISLYYFWRHGQWQLFLPRLFSGILVGYIPLLTAGDPWKWLLRLPIFTAWLISILFFIASFFYLRFEARKALGESILEKSMHKEVLARVCYVFFIGLFESLCIGVLLNELFTVAVIPTIIEGIEDTPVIMLVGWVGYILPKLILIYAPFALFLGILIQLIWEDKTVTQPL